LNLSCRHFCLFVGLSLSACRSPLEHKQDADQEVYQLIQNRQDEIFGGEDRFTIEPPEDSLRSRILRGEVESLETVGLAVCLGIAAENNRDYQERKESLYRAALDLTLERWRLGWIANGGGDAGIDGLASHATLQSGSGALGLRRVLGTGAEIVGSLGLSIVKDLTSGGRIFTSTSASLLFTQPLLAGAGELIVYEDLTQAERDLVYEVRSFERFRRQLAVDLAGRILRLHQDLERIENERRNYENVVAIRERNEALSLAGRFSAIQVDQARQNELSSEDRLIGVRQSYENSVDSFKLLLGLPINIPLSIDMGSLDSLANSELPKAGISDQLAFDFACSNRPDFLTAVDRVVDAERQSRVAADALSMGLDLTSAIRAPSGADEPLSYNFKDVSWDIGLVLDLPIDRLPQRNAYRTALIRWQSAARGAAEFQDSMFTDLRASLREMKSSQESLAIQDTAVALAEKRVESAGLNLQAGRASTRDLLEAQDALVSSRNGKNAALIDLTLTRLQLALDMGLLRIDETGIRMESTPELAAQEVSDE
jgi:outer membrane protein TolC